MTLLMIILAYLGVAATTASVCIAEQGRADELADPQPPWFLFAILSLAWPLLWFGLGCSYLLRKAYLKGRKIGEADQDDINNIIATQRLALRNANVFIIRRAGIQVSYDENEISDQALAMMAQAIQDGRDLTRAKEIAGIS